MNFHFEAVGVVSSDFKEKFGIPRQPGLVPSAQAIIRLPRHRFEAAVEGLEGFSHIWVVFVFHEAGKSKVRVRPPRLGGARKIGVFASRSPHRPNPIGISSVRLEGIEISGREILLRIRGADLLDGTPVLDIKPYIRYADSIPRATLGWADTKRVPLRVSFSSEANRELQVVDPRGSRELKKLIREILRQDPRPAFQKERESEADYAFRLAELDVHWAIRNGKAYVRELRRL